MLPLNKKSQEIAIALTRVGVYIRRPSLKTKIEHLGVQLIEDVTIGGLEEATRTISALDGLVNFGGMVYEIEPMSARVILRELSLLNSAIRQSLGLPANENGNPAGAIESVFSKQQIPLNTYSNINKRQPVSMDVSSDRSISLRSAGSENGGVAATIDVPVSYLGTKEDANSNGNGHQNGNGINAVIRQTRIMERIRQSESKQIQLKQLIADLPEVSERTLRYDLQKLCGQGLIERVGNGGPATYYVMKS